MKVDSIKAIILGASRGIRHLDPNKSLPLSLQELGKGGRVLDWILHAFSMRNISSSNIVFVGGYHVEKVLKEYPGLKYYFHSGWSKEGELEALRLAIKEIDGPCFICNTNVVFRDGALLSLRESGGQDIALGLFKKYEDKSIDGHIVDLAWFGRHGIAVLRDFLTNTELRKLDLAGLFQEIARQSSYVKQIDISSNCAVLNDRFSLSHFVLGTKAQTLERLRPILRRAVVLEQFRFSVGDWRISPDNIIDQIVNRFESTSVVLRSSTGLEDAWASSHAGRFASVLDVDTTDKEALFNAVNKVIDSYKDAGLRDSESCDEVLVQPYLKNVIMSGVILTRDLETGAPYYIITIDRVTGRTDTVTAGNDPAVETFIVFRDAQSKLPEPFLEGLISMACELEELIGYDGLDIEFGKDMDGKLYVFQARPLIINRKDISLADDDFVGELTHVKEYVKDLMKPHPRLKGKTTGLGNMPDWNPAEMIGAAPRPLTLSLYQTLITDYAWAEARRRMGYRDVATEPLMIALAGLPYIDLRTSFNSFLPATLNDEAGEHLVNAYLDYLRANPELHDKIEFDVVVTCLSFDFDKRVECLRPYGLTNEDIIKLKNSLLELTDTILLGEKSAIDLQISLIKKLTDEREKILSVDTAVGALPRKVNWLIRDCVRYGTIPFSILARYAFISMSFLKALKNCGIFSIDEYNAFLNGIPTIATDVSRNLKRLVKGELSEDDFIKNYGHLRPGTYDIQSPNYKNSIHSFVADSTMLRYSCSEATGRQADIETPLRIFNQKKAIIEKVLVEFGFKCDAQRLFDFITHSIPAREWAKFEFTKNVNEIIESVAAYCGHLGLSREEASCLSIERILRLATDSSSVALQGYFKRISGFELKRHLLATAMRFPHLIWKADDLEGFKLPECHPNFVTNQRVIAEVIDLDQNPPPHKLKGRIALIRGADPGYDWIFGCGPAGLVSQFGGAASHMTIRAAEFGLPSAIGCGDLIYERLRKAMRVEIDCANKRIVVVQ